jgi:hypothetical protein
MTQKFDTCHEKMKYKLSLQTIYVMRFEEHYIEGADLTILLHMRALHDLELK